MLSKQFQLTLANVVTVKNWLNNFVQAKTEADVMQKIKIYDAFIPAQDFLDSSAEKAKVSTPEELAKLNEEINSKELRTFVLDSASLDWFKKIWKDEIPKNFAVYFKDGSSIKGLSSESDCRIFSDILTALESATVVKPEAVVAA